MAWRMRMFSSIMFLSGWCTEGTEEQQLRTEGANPLLLVVSLVLKSSVLSIDEPADCSLSAPSCGIEQAKPHLSS